MFLHKLRASVTLLLPAVAVLLLLASTGHAQDFMERSYADEFFLEGVALYNDRSYEGAIEMFRSSLGRVPDNNLARYFLGMAYFKAGYEENAQFEFNTIVRTERDNLVLVNICSQIMEYMNKKHFLARDFQKSLEYSLNLTLEGDPIGKYILSKVTGLDLDRKGNIYAAAFGSKIALKMSPEGEPLLQFIDPRISPGRLYDIVLGPSGVFISDFTNDVVYRFDREGKYLGTIGGPGFEEGRFYGPTSLATDQDGNLYVIDSGNLRVEKFTPEGELLLVFGRRGDEEGELEHPSGIAVDDAGRIYVSDHGKKAVYVYDSSGNFITSLEGADLEDPYGISFADERLVISDRTSIKVYDLSHSTWTELGLQPELARVLDARIGPLGQLALTDFEQDHLLQFTPEEDRYRNLTVILNNVDADDHPAIVYNVSVLDADGLPLYGLDTDNFQLQIGGAGVDKIDLRLNQVRDSRLNLLFLVDKSLSMQEYEEEVAELSGDLLDQVGEDDQMMAVSFNRDSWVSSSFTGSRLRTLDAIREDRYGEGKTFGAAFRKAMDYINKRFYKKAIVVITDGLEEGSFQQYSFNSCVNYAANNNVPVYFLVLGRSPNPDLDYFARSTGGGLYQVFTSNELPYLYQTMRAHRTPEYSVLFEDVYDPDLRNLFIHSGVEIEFNSRFGRGLLGFVYP